MPMFMDDFEGIKTSVKGGNEYVVKKSRELELEVEPYEVTALL